MSPGEPVLYDNSVNPSVSVIIPTYNRREKLARAIESVLKQKGPSFELIIVDDGSTDGTHDMIVGARGPRLSQKGGETPPLRTDIKYLYQSNQGPAAARNLGIKNSNGEFIAFLDSDDEWLPGKLKAQLQFFEDNPDSLICQTEEIWIRNGRRVNPMKKHKKYGGWIFEKCLPLCIISPSAVMMRKEFFDRVGLFDESLPACEDYDLWLRASARFPIGLIEKSYAIKYGGHPDQRSHQFPVMDRFRVYALEKIIKSGSLNPAQLQSAHQEFDRKSNIITLGARKRSFRFTPEKIYLHEEARDYPFAKIFLERFPEIPCEIVTDKNTLLKNFKKNADPIGAGKRFVFLDVDQGRAFKPFPTPEGTLPCNFYSLHLVEGCDLECSYCILQTYLTFPMTTIYVNVEEILDQLGSFLKSRPEDFFRIGTGQLADSLSLDPITAHTEILVPFFARQKNAALELKTKSVNIDRLKNLDHQNRTIVSWSINTQRIQREEEHKCASIEERIAAAKQCIEWGYRVGFHFDPLIDYEGCLEEYEDLIEMIFSNISTKKMAWVSLGSLRFMPELKRVMEKRFPKSPLPYAEWVRGTDGKMRYFKKRRVEMYRHLTEKIRGIAPELRIYLCMETEEVWNQVFDESSSQSIQENLDQVAFCQP